MAVDAGAEEVSKELNDLVLEQNQIPSPVADQRHQQEQPYSIYTRNEKWWLVAIVALAGFLSPLPATIYFPVIPQLTKVFHESTEAVNTTVTVYLVFQGLGPMLWGTLSDQWGRRPVILICLGILTLSCIGLALTPTDAFWLLFLLRCFQSAGCASTIALGAGLIGDVAESKDRGGYMGLFSTGPMIATCIAPVIGGALGQALGWRAIFWFLVIFAGVSMVFITLFLPETLRALVGNGSVRPGPIHKPIIQLFGRGKQTSNPAKRTGKRKPFQNPFVILTYPDVIITQAFTGIIYAVWYAVTATISSTFDEVYPSLTEAEIGLCYLSMGGGMVIGSMSTGKLLDWEYRRLRRKHERTDDEAQFGKGRGKYSIEVVRLRLMPAHVLLKAACEIGWGWCLGQRVHIAGPLVLQFMIGYCSIATLNTTMTLMIDILPNQSSASAACTNFVRCSLASVLVACINLATRKLGVGPTYTLLGGIELLMLPAMFLQMRIGPNFRMKREAAKEGAA